MTKTPFAPTRREAIRAAAALGLVTVLAPGSLRAAETATSSGRVTLVLVNDLDRMADLKGRGGHARLAAVAKAERARGNAILVHGAMRCRRRSCRASQNDDPSHSNEDDAKKAT